MFLVGGVWRGANHKNTQFKTIHQLVCADTPASCKWEETEVELKHALHGPVVLSIDESLALDLCNQ